MELYQELLLYKEKLKNQALSLSHSHDMMAVPEGGFTDLKGVELEEENMHLTAENLELRQKLKQLSEKNTLLQARVVELNEIIRDLSESGGRMSPGPDGSKFLKLREENE